MPPEPFQEINLKPGEYGFGEGNTRIRTLLGSCISITFWHPDLQFGGMCHYLLPTRSNGLGESPSGKFGDEVIRLFASRFRQMRISPESLQVKLFGGASMFHSLTCADSMAIGERNIALGRRLLKEEGFRIYSEDTGHCVHRTIIFELWTGDVWVRHSPTQCEASCIAACKEGASSHQQLECPHVTL